MNETATRKTRMFPKPIKAMLPIPVSAIKAIALKYGYDQVVILGRRIGSAPMPCGEHITTFGRDHAHCNVAAMMGKRMATLCQWPEHERTALDIDAWRAAIQYMRDQFSLEPGKREQTAYWDHALKQFEKSFPSKVP